jgi:hydroxyacylglutathione hydrolase
MKRINRDGPRIRGDAARPPQLTLAPLVEALATGAPVVDARAARSFAERAIPGTINIPANRSFATWCGWLLPYDRECYLIADDRPNAVSELVRAMAGIGLNRVAGWVGAEIIDEWHAAGRPLTMTPRLDLREVTDEVGAGRIALIDVRSRAEWAAGHLPDAINLPLGELDQRLSEIPRGRPLVVHCQTGGRAAIAASLLRARGVSDVRLYGGGFAEWSAAGQPVERETRVEVP